MSYRQAWQMVEEMNQFSTLPLVEKQLGGKSGGGTKVTEAGERAIKAFHTLENKVNAFGFFNTKEIPSLAYSKLEYDFLSAKELNWFGKPSSMVVKNFIHEDYDLLIDLNVHDHFVLKYISALSKSKFKVGKYNEKDESIYDMMIDADNTQTLKYFLRQVDIYIAMLNKVEPSLN